MSHDADPAAIPRAPTAVDVASLDRVWRLADATLREHRHGDVAAMVWATMQALGWVMGAATEAPVSEQREANPDRRRVDAELALCLDQTRAAASKAEYARLKGIAEGLLFALGEPGPFWWTSLERGVRRQAG